ncbi:MAG: hypothetical protein WD604_16490 [Balneolaceae bacterium]
MPNGKPGDHPLTDILNHGQSEYGEPVDGMVKEMSKHPKFSQVRDQVGKILMEESPMGKEKSKRQDSVQNAINRLKRVQQQIK